jgi:superfamily I DNA and RNA helicase
MSSTWWKDPDELRKEQGDILELPLDESLLLKGPPGSGKTNLLLLRANHLFLSKRANLHIVVFGSVLRNFIQLGGGQYKFPADKIITHAQLFGRMLSEYDAEVDTKKMTFIEGREAKASAMTKLIDQGKVGQIFDALLIDEAQDYFTEEIRIFRAITKTLVAAADIRQKVFNVEDSSNALRACVDNEYQLNFHFRNGLNICRLADGIMKGNPNHTPLVVHSSYDEKAYPSRVKERKGLSIDQQAQAIAEQLGDQRLAYPNELIGILCPRNEEVDAITERLKAMPIGSEITKCNEKSFDPSRPIWITTISSAKGLEFRAVHLAGLDYLSRTGPVQKRLAFTGGTRAKTSLTLYYENNIPGYLDSALALVAPVMKPVTKSNIFGKD